jgi:hypothetical protein
MIDADFIIRYTNALYATPAEFAPRYDEFRDMFSSGQIQSKNWLIKELSEYSALLTNSRVLIAGAWFGTLGLLLKQAFPKASVTLLDVDPRCEIYTNHVMYGTSGINSVTCDMYKYNYTESVIINTSCEHIEDLPMWLSLIPSNTIVVLQSNNFTDGGGHVNCVNSKEEFINNTGLTNIWYSGQLSMPMYTRYMIIGRV